MLVGPYDQGKKAILPSNWRREHYTLGVERSIITFGARHSPVRRCQIQIGLKIVEQDFFYEDTQVRVPIVTMCLCDAILYSHHCLYISRVISTSREHKSIKA